MSIEKKFLKAKPVCKVKFSVSGDQYKSASNIHVLGDFNNWKYGETPLKKSKAGTWSASLDLQAGNEYQFRYLIDERQWENEPEADRTVPAGIGASENSVIVL
jgi:1,4-alpha-glucan branching enzyme